MAEPSLPPKQLTLVLLPIALVSKVGSVIMTEEADVHPRSSVIVTVYEPADKLFSVALVPPEDQRYVYGGVPPEPLTVAEASLPVKQLTLVIDVMADVSKVGSVIMTEEVAVHPRLSVTVTTYVLAIRLMIVAVVSPFDQL